MPARRHLRRIAIAAVLAAIVGACGGQAAPTPTPAPVITPVPDYVIAPSALQAFEGLAGNPQLSFHFVETISVTRAQATTTSTFTIDVAGTDFSADVVTGGATTSLRDIGGKGWIKEPGKDWVQQQVEATPAAEASNPWVYLGWIRGLGFSGRSATHPDAFEFTSKAPYTYQTVRMRRLGQVGTVSQLAVDLLADGTPVEVRLSGQEPDAGGNIGQYEATLTFSNVGQPVTITPPS